LHNSATLTDAQNEGLDTNAVFPHLSLQFE
jgi:hypothetical protein